MTKFLRRSIPVLLTLAATAAHAQFNYKYYHDHGASLSVGATGDIGNTQLTYKPNAGVTTVPTTGFTTQAVSNQQQNPTMSVGFISTFAFHPVAFAGIELNYGFTHHSEVFSFNYATSGAKSVYVSTDIHEATGAYQFHPKHIPFQPFVNVGGGALDFAPRNASSQIRGAGLLEAGFDLPTHSSHIGFRIEGRSLYYRAPNFYTPAISTGSWRVTTQPSVSTYYRF